MDPFTKRSIFFCVFSLFLGILNYITDILVAIALANEDDTDWWLTLTLIFVIVPLMIVNSFSIFWFHQDHLKFRKYKKKKKDTNGASKIATDNKTISEEVRHPVGAIFKPASHAFSEKERKVIISSHVLGLGPILRYSKITNMDLLIKSVTEVLSAETAI